MLDHNERIAAARSAVEYITGRSADELERPVPNCPGWTIYNAAAHIGRVGIAWQEMINATPDDPDSRARGYERSGQQPPGTPVAELATWANAALDLLNGDTERRCYFSIAGGEGTVALWAWHAASELAVHRLDVEAALDHPYSLTDAQALDAVTYICQFFLPGMRRVTDTDPGQAIIRLRGDDDEPRQIVITSDSTNTVTVDGPPIQMLLALMGRPHHDIEVVDGDQQVWQSWQELPSKAFQLGTWD